jgi:hypothetical protein
VITSRAAAYLDEILTVDGAVISSEGDGASSCCWARSISASEERGEITNTP